jgi:hypothetical protein
MKEVERVAVKEAYTVHIINIISQGQYVVPRCLIIFVCIVYAFVSVLPACQWRRRNARFLRYCCTTFDITAIATATITAAPCDKMFHRHISEFNILCRIVFLAHVCFF